MDLDELFAELEKPLRNKKPPKPVAVPAWDPFQEVEVIDSRHLFKPQEPDEFEDYKTATARPRRARSLDPSQSGRPAVIHLRGKDGEILCSDPEPIFHWTWQPSEADCYGCKTRTAAYKAKRADQLAQIRAQRRERKQEQKKERSLKLVQTQFQGEQIIITNSRGAQF